jgi:hypothetical protein
LDRFAPGRLYVVGTSLGSYLLALGAAEPVLDESPALITPLGDQLTRPPASLKRVASTPRLLHQAADRRVRPKKR